MRSSRGVPFDECVDAVAPDPDTARPKVDLLEFSGLHESVERRAAASEEAASLGLSKEDCFLWFLFAHAYSTAFVANYVACAGQTQSQRLVEP